MIDSHCHLADEAFAGDLQAVVERAVGAGLRGALCVIAADDAREIECAGPIRDLWPEVRFAVGIHPHRAGAFGDARGEVASYVMSRLARLPGACAVGEMGLDYHYDFAPAPIQRAVFEQQLGLAVERGLPVVVHAREADEDVLGILSAAGAVRGVMHCFTGDIAFARRVLDLGMAVSLAGIVTFPKATALREVAKFVPEDRLLVETDSPYLAPVPHRGRRNEPAFVTHVADAVAAARGVTRESVVEATSRCFASLFGPAGRAGCVD